MRVILCTALLLALAGPGAGGAADAPKGSATPQQKGKEAPGQAAKPQDAKPKDKAKPTRSRPAYPDT